MPVQSLFLGASTVIITDGASSILIDGFFSRPSLPKLVWGKVQPDRARIDEVLARAGITSIDLLVVSHSHVDHALDCPIVARATGARLAGSSSTLMVARGLGFDESRFVELDPGVTLTAGDFVVTPIRAVHSNGDRFPGEIVEPVVPPAKAAAYRTGACFDFHLQHPDASVLVHPTANFIPGALRDHPADVIYLGAGAAGLESEAWRNRYWDETVVATGASVVLPIHWDRFWRPLSAPLSPLPARLDDLDATLATWMARANASRIDLRLPEAWVWESLDA